MGFKSIQPSDLYLLTHLFGFYGTGLDPCFDGHWLPHPRGPQTQNTGFCAHPLTFFEHAHFETLHEAAGLAGFASALRDFTFIRGWAAVFYVTCSAQCEGKR